MDHTQYSLVISSCIRPIVVSHIMRQLFHRLYNHDNIYFVMYTTYGERDTILFYTDDWDFGGVAVIIITRSVTGRAKQLKRDR